MIRFVSVGAKSAHAIGVAWIGSPVRSTGRRIGFWTQGSLMQTAAVRDLLVRLGEAAADRARVVLTSESLESRSSVHTVASSDVIYRIDHEVDEVIVAMLEKEAESVGGVHLVAEGIGDGDRSTYPKGLDASRAAVTVLMDPIDGTRGLMFDKRPAFFLAGAAPTRDRTARLSDIETAVMVEIPNSRMADRDTLSAVRGQGIVAARRSLATGKNAPFDPSPSAEPSIRGGFAQISRFFSPGKDVLARIEEDLLEAIFPDRGEGEIVTFEDQYIASGGQLYEMLTGKDRFVAELRGALYRQRRREGRIGSHTCHAYDLSASLVATEAGVILTDLDGASLDVEFDASSSVDWVAYASEAIRAEVEPHLAALLDRYGLRGD